MSSAFITIAPPPKPPPSDTATNLSKPFGLFNCLALDAALVKLALSTVLPYRLVLIALTSIGAKVSSFHTCVLNSWTYRFHSYFTSTIQL
jgi:hypothetical protein